MVNTMSIIHFGRPRWQGCMRGGAIPIPKFHDCVLSTTTTVRDAMEYWFICTSATCQDSTYLNSWHCTIWQDLQFLLSQVSNVAALFNQLRQNANVNTSQLMLKFNKQQDNLLKHLREVQNEQTLEVYTESLMSLFFGTTIVDNFLWLKE